jgi:serine protease Do
MTRRSALLFALILATPLAAEPQRGLAGVSKDFEELAERIGPAVVQIVTSGYGPSDGNATGASGVTLSQQRSGGSGSILTPEGHILTNAHVVDGASRIQVLLAARFERPGETRSVLKPTPRLRTARLLGIDRETDLALIKIEEKDLPHLEFADSDDLRQGQLVFAFGSPLGLENSMTMGIVSAPARQLESDSPMIYVQTDAAINPGNSGGPLVNADGRIVGVNTMIYSQSGGNEGVGFAAPSNIAQAVAIQLRETGGVRRGEIGVTAQTITPQMAAGLGLTRDWGVILGDVRPGGPGANAGLQIGDIIVAMNGKPMENGRQFQVNLYQRRIADVVRLDILRGAERLQIGVVVLEREDDPERFARMVETSRGRIEELGVLAVSYNRELARMLPLMRRRSGVIVAALTAEGPYWKELFRPGDIIHSVNGKETAELPALREALAGLESGTPVVVQIERNGEMSYQTFQYE